MKATWTDEHDLSWAVETREHDVDWGIEELLLDPDPPAPAATNRCGNCGSPLYTNGTCPLCDRA